MIPGARCAALGTGDRSFEDYCESEDQLLLFFETLLSLSFRTTYFETNDFLNEILRFTLQDWLLPLIILPRDR